MEKEIVSCFLHLVRLGIEHIDSIDVADISQLNLENWDALKSLATKQGLLGVVLDGLDKLPITAYNMPPMLKKQWIGEVLQRYESRYELYRKTIAEMAGFYNKHGFQLMVLKGYACSLEWPKPEHRPCGDIDIWLFGHWREADATLTKEKGITIDNSHHHHTVFYWRDFMVENHYDFIEVHHHSSSPGIEKILKEKGTDDSYSVDVDGEKVYLPSPDLHALFLLRHSMEHFASTDISLRQLLDWAFFVRAQGKDIDWNWLEGVLREYGMKGLYDIFNAICVEDLGFDASLFPKSKIERRLKTRVLNEIISPEFKKNEPKAFFPRVYFKWCRWRANGWKHDLCYKGSRWSAFWSATWNHLLKPSSI